jgi:outer membrane protein assembly factor BamB
MQPLPKGDWSDAIKPLDEGDFPVEEFVMAMQKIKFDSKMFLHNYGIKQSPLDHLSRSMTKWNEMVESTGIELNTQLDLILDNPENVCWDETTETWFISNLGGEKVTLEEDAYGWITRLDKNRKILSNRWIEGLDAPTGMAVYKNKLYVGDRGVVVEIDISKGEIIRKIPLPGAEFINDVAVSSKGEVYISDTFGNRIYRLNKKGKVEVFLENAMLDYPNGLWVDGDDLIVATWGTITNRETFETSKNGTLLRVDLRSKEISPVGKGMPIANIDGVVKYGDFFYVTDWTGGRLLQVSEEGDVKEIVTGFNQFADLGIDTKNGIVVIPEMSKNRFIMVNLKALEKQ